MKRLWLIAIILVPLGVSFVFEPVRIWVRRLWYDTEETRYPRWITWFARHQESDGTWYPGSGTIDGHAIGRPGATSLALLPQMAAGYSHLSKDTYEGHAVGKSISRAIQWLIKDQRPDGSFASSQGSMDHVLATHALCESYGMTGSTLLKAPAQKAIDALVQLHQQPGSFDSPALQAWAMMTFQTAEWDELSFPRSSHDRVRKFFDERLEQPPCVYETVARILLDAPASNSRIAEGVGRLLSSLPHWDQQDFERWHWGSVALFMYDGKAGPNWRAWEAPLKKTVFNTGRWRGEWQGSEPGETLVRTSLAAQTGCVWYRYSNIVKVK